MTKTYTIKPGQKPTEEQLKEVEKAKKKPIVYDEDCQEISEAMETSYEECRFTKKSKEEGIVSI